MAYSEIYVILIFFFAKWIELEAVYKDQTSYKHHTHNSHLFCQILNQDEFRKISTDR